MMLDIIVSFLLSVLSGMGVGGGGLLVIYLTLISGIKQFSAQGLNLIFFLAASLSALAVNIRRRKLSFAEITALAVPGAVFSVIGALLAAHTDVSLLRKIFGGLLILSGGISLFSKS